MTRGYFLILALLAATGIAACTGATPTADPTPVEGSRPPDPSPSSAMAEPTPTATAVANPAPDELIGGWTTTIALGEVVVLRIEPGTYRIVRGGNSGSGLIDVTGNEITFHSSNLCSGPGTYSWLIADGQLTFTPTSDDPCDGRSLVLGDVTYEK